MFVVNIAIGNDAMRTPFDVAQELRHIAAAVEVDRAPNGMVVDRNGNIVGNFALIDDARHGMRWENI